MASFSDESLMKLSACHRDLQRVFFEVIKHFDCTVIEGYRNQEAQDEAYKSGHTNLQWPDGKHNKNPSLAVDVSPCPVDWKNTSRFYWFGGFVIGIAIQLQSQNKITHSIRYGGDWDGDYDIDDQKFLDLVHFELIT